MPRITIAKEDSVVLLRVELEAGRSYTIGREDSASIRLDAPSVSRRHAVILPFGRGWLIADVGSTSGIWNEEGRILAEQLQPGRWVCVGTGYIWFEDDETESDWSTSNESEAGTDAVSRTPAGDEVLLIEGSFADTPRIVKLAPRRAIMIGSASGCDVTISEPEIAPAQVAIFATKKGWQAVSTCEDDLLTPEGVACRNASFDSEKAVLSGALKLTKRRVVVPDPLPVAPPGGSSSALRRHPREGEVDLEAVAKQGRNRNRAGDRGA